MSRLLTETVVLDLRFHRPGIVRKGTLDGVQVDADKDLLRLNKQIIESDKYLKYCNLCHKLKCWIAARSLSNWLFNKGEEDNGNVSTSLFREGTFLVPITNLEDIYLKCEEVRDEAMQVVDEFIAEYPQLIQDAERRLKGQFDPTNYYSPQEMRRRFGIEWRLIEFGLPTAGKIGEVMFRQEQKKVSSELKEAEQEVIQALRESMLGLIDKVVSQLSPSPDGKRRYITESAVEKLIEFLDLFASRNIMQDGELQNLAEKAKKIIKGVDVQLLRKVDNFREVVKMGMEEIKDNLSVMVKEGPRRVFDI